VRPLVGQSRQPASTVFRDLRLSRPSARRHGHRSGRETEDKQAGIPFISDTRVRCGVLIRGLPRGLHTASNSSVSAAATRPAANGSIADWHVLDIRTLSLFFLSRSIHTLLLKAKCPLLIACHQPLSLEEFMSKLHSAVKVGPYEFAHRVVLRSGLTRQSQRKRSTR
jgi:hypothetical protein